MPDITRFLLPSVDPAQLGRLAKHLLRLRQTDPGIVLTNRGGWHSHNIQDDPELAPFNTGILAAARRLTGEASLSTHNAWANVNEQGDFMIPHQHSGVFLVAVLMVQPVPSGAEDEGVLMLEKRPGQMVSVDPAPQAGDVLMFPGSILHTVTPHRQSSPRITLAYNLALPRK